MEDCASGFFDNHHGQFVKDGDDMAFYGGYDSIQWKKICLAFRHPPSIILVGNSSNSQTLTH
jgi:hypothetical protein